MAAATDMTHTGSPSGRASTELRRKATTEPSERKPQTAITSQRASDAPST